MIPVHRAVEFHYFMVPRKRKTGQNNFLLRLPTSSFMVLRIWRRNHGLKGSLNNYQSYARSIIDLRRDVKREPVCSEPFNLFLNHFLRFF
ncbi:hypothetical protein TNCT_710681 [Trichonephila clavata]|uniref:Uncharacterized protein n=1 Tax=Trichonephila clavata TaxID=2740835 RepID=A0A8X6KD10_TRICU|nr:hypothetical protein TNCT_710681 [Trichonephila clavata]